MRADVHGEANGNGFDHRDELGRPPAASAGDGHIAAPNLRYFVMALFVLASGVVIVQVVANPLISLLGRPAPCTAG